MSRESSYDHHITIFSPQGKLYQVEYAIKATATDGLTSGAVRGQNTVAVVTQKKVPDRLIDPASVSNIFKITDKIGAVMTGLNTDAKSQVTNLRMIAHEYRFDYGYDIPVDVLARKIADKAQIYTQQASKRVLAVMTILVGVDEERGPQIFKVDPAGHYFPYKATAAGAKEQEAMNYLEKRVNEFGQMDDQLVVETAIMCLQSALSTDFRGTEIEVGIATGNGKFKSLGDEEIDSHLNSISERDI